MANKTQLHTSDQTSAPEEDLTKPTGRRTRRRAAVAVCRLAQRGKRQSHVERRHGSGEKRRGSGEKRRGQKERRRGQEEKKEGVTVKRTWSDGKRHWDKKHYCTFCRRPQVKIARHLLRKHADQQEVAAASMLPTGSKQRHLLLEHLRCRGNYMHNIEVIRQGSGEIIPWRQPSEEVDARNYLPCPLCLGFFLRADLWKHQVSCRKKLTSDPSKDLASTAEKTLDPVANTTSDSVDDRTSKSTEDTLPEPSEDSATIDETETSETMTKRTLTSDPNLDQNMKSDSVMDQPRKRSRVQAAASRLLPISSGASESCSEVLHRMNQDHVSHQVKSDWLICKYGNKLMGNQDGSRYGYVSQKLRELGRFLLAAKSLDSSIQTLQDLLAPGHLSLVLAAARKASGYRWSRPPLAVKTTLKTVCEIAIGESLQDGDWEAAAKTTNFYHQLGREWDNLGLLNPDLNTAPPVEGPKLKKQSVQSWSEMDCKEPSQELSDPRSEIQSQSCNQLVTSVIPQESRLHTTVTVPVGPRKVRRRPWSSAEKEAVWRQLGVHVLVQSVPGKEVCQRCLDLEPVLRGRHWKDIKNQIHNQIQSQKKQQFHAQMDLQENKEQNQIDNQKKQQQQYQAQMSQQSKDHTQNQKQQHSQMDHDVQDNTQIKRKQQYNMQIDPQDQGNIQNNKKQQYHTQLDPGHLHIHKKQLCHATADSQHHVHIHKKQLYPIDEQTQGLQTSLDRDTTILSSTLYGPNEPHQATGQSLLEQDPTISPYPLPHRTLMPHMDQLLSRTEWTDESLSQHYSMSRQLDRNLLQDTPLGGPPANMHSGHVPF